MILNNEGHMIFNALPGQYLILKPDTPKFTILDMNEAYSKVSMLSKQVIGKGVFEVMNNKVDYPGTYLFENLEVSLMKVLESKQPHRMLVQRYDVLNLETGDVELHFWLPENIPVIDQNKEVLYIIHSVTDVTSSVILEEAENKSQQELQRMHEEQSQILESIADGFLSTDLNWIVKYWNRQAEKIFNIGRNEILGRYLWDVIKESYAKKLYECFNEAMNKKKPVHFEKYYSLQDKWLQINAYPSEQGLTSFLVDITESKKAQEVLHLNERRFRALIENISDGLAIISTDGLIIDLSYSGKKILGYKSQDLIGNYRYNQLIHPSDLNKVKNAFKHVVKASTEKSSFISRLMPSTVQSVLNSPNHYITVEFRFKMKDGSYKWLEGTFHNLMHEGTINAIVLNFSDITKRHEQEEQLQASEEKYRYLFHKSPATIIIWTLDDLCIQEVNETAINLFGYTRNELLSMSVLDMRPVEDHERIINLSLELKKRGATNTGVWKYKTKKGDTMFMNVSLHKINYGNKDAVLTLGTNVTEKIMLQKKLEEERLQKQKEITEAVLTAQENERAELGKELHDNINQILTTTRLFIEHALSKKEKQVELLEQSREYITKAIHEIRQLSHKLMPPSLGEVSLKHALEELILNLKSLKGYKFEFEFFLEHEELISAPLKLAIFRIIQEQLNNIVKHAEATKIATRIMQLDHEVQVYVKDNGKGFNQQKGPRGLGLRNITSRANLFRGQVEINSQIGKGTELQVIFPLPA